MTRMHALLAAVALYLPFAWTIGASAGCFTDARGTSSGLIARRADATGSRIAAAGSPHLFSQVPADADHVATSNAWAITRGGTAVATPTRAQWSGLFGGNAWTPFPQSTEPLIEPLPLLRDSAETPVADLVSYTYDDQPAAKPAAVRPPPRFRWRTLPDPYELALRAGWWGMHTDGSQTKVGEWQSLKPSPFWDVDGLLSNGTRTLDFFATGLDQETTQTGLHFFGPRFGLDFQYQRFLHRLDHDPLTGFADVNAQQPGGDFYVKEDLNTGEDYAIRVQELKAKFKGKLTKNIQWGLNLWGMRKKGERQVTAMAHCFNVPNGTDINGNPVAGPVFGNACHIQSQRQTIDWLTMEIEPVVKATLGPATVEYARTMRSFSQDDQLVTRPYDHFGFNGDLPYAVVPDNYTAIDRLKMNVDLSRQTDLYAHLYNGNTLNRFRRTNRRFRGYDLRLTNWSIDGLTWTAYAKQYVQTGQTPATLLPEESLVNIRTPIKYNRTTAGIKGRWRPFRGECSWRSKLAISSGYEYRGLDRGNAVFTEDTGTFNESFTTANLVHLRASMRWGPTLDSYVRYRLGFVDDPLYGIAKNGITNSALPTQSHLIEIGTTWSPADRFLLSATFGIDNRWNKSNEADSQQDAYPIIFSGWYAPTARWSLSGGLAFFRSWIDQDITLGSQTGPITSGWSYGGRSDVINLGTTYAWTERLTLSGGFEYARGRDAFASPALWPDLPQYSAVVVQTTRWRAGVNYLLRRGIACYLRYQYFDYNDESQQFNSGTASMFLAGIDAVY